MSRLMCFFILVLLQAVLSSCFPATTIPIGTIALQQSGAVNKRSLLVFLPGRGDTSASYGTEGFIAELKQSGIDVDSLGVEAHLGYYRDRTLLHRLKEDVIDPAKQAGYREIWLVGISMGGLGALLYDTAYPGDVNGLIVLAPFLGEGSLLKEISTSGGLSSWHPAKVNNGDLEQEIWLKLKEYAGDGKKGAGRVFLGFGESDRFATTNRFFAASLPTCQVLTAPGGHDWPTWRALWPRLLELVPVSRTKK
jgi:pimeloyl-ACP methyl ester carboxylesterase